MTGDYVIFSSTDGLAETLIDTLQHEPAGTGPKGAYTALEVEGPALRAILAKNREGMIRKNMVEKGNSHEPAENDVNGLLTMLDCLEHGWITLARDAGHPQATLELKLRLPTNLP